jgi:hypothetical protein
VRPWSTVLRIPTDAGDLWFKAGNVAQGFEVGVVQILAERRPDLVPRLLAVDVDRGWMLQGDGGERLREWLEPDSDHGVWVDILPRYAELQIAVAPDAERLVAAGAPDRRLALLPGQFEELVHDREALHALTVDELRRLGALAPAIEADCAELERYRLPETIQHDDLHDGQVFVRDGAYVFFDWGDSCVSHPFFTLVVTLALLAHRLGIEPDARELERFRDAYLQAWTGFGGADELVHAYPISHRLGTLCRGLTWARIECALPTALREDTVPERMRMLLELYGG